ncbi:MAG: OsmC family protein [Thaumarchaeota archaeon]|nr:OsmC family protein [Nitrososphaerota archaeon]
MANNVNQAEIQKFVNHIKSNPQDAKRSKRIEGEWVFEEGKPQFHAALSFQKGRTTLECELPHFAGGWGGAPDPVQYCLYGLAACYASTFVAAATSIGVELTILKIVAENQMNLTKQLGLSSENIIENVRFTVIAKGNASNEVMQRVKEMADQRCPGVECITRSIPLVTELVWK